MAQNGSELPRMDQNCSMARNGSEWRRMVQNGSEWLRTMQNRNTGFAMVPPTWFQPDDIARLVVHRFSNRVRGSYMFIYWGRSGGEPGGLGGFFTGVFCVSG